MSAVAAASSKKALGSYLRALRATRIAFKGDLPVLTASRARIRDSFKNPDLSKSLEQRLKEIDDVSTFLMRNIVQGKRVSPLAEKFQLNIHKHTELGDNDSIKKTKKVLVSQGGGCCGGSSAKI